MQTAVTELTKRKTFALCVCVFKNVYTLNFTAVTFGGRERGRRIPTRNVLLV